LATKGVHNKRSPAPNQNSIQEASYFGVLAHSELQRNVNIMDVGQHSQGRKQSSGLHGFIGSQFSLLGTQLYKHKHGTFISFKQETKIN
jgi:hypothetical protein